MRDIAALRALFMDTVYVFNLADLAFLLERFYLFHDNDFWQSVKAKLTDYASTGITDNTRLQKIGTHQARISVESLLKKNCLVAAYWIITSTPLITD